MQIARKLSYTPNENERGRLWLRIGGRTYNFIMTKEVPKENGVASNIKPLKGLFRKCVWIGFGTKKFQKDQVHGEEDFEESTLADEKRLDMK